MSPDISLTRRNMLGGMVATGIALQSGGLSTAARAAHHAAGGHWYDKPFRLVQTNLREPDILNDPARMARQVREFGGDAMIINIGGIVAFYPTELELQVRNPFMRPGQDFVREMLAAGRAEGLTMIGRFDLSKAQRRAYEAYPEWFVETRAGGPLVYEGTYQACPNGNWGLDYGNRIIKEALGQYDVDGVFFNMPGYPRTDYSGVNHGSCVCDNCKARFAEMYGLALPEVDGFADPVWPQYLEFKDVTADALAKLNYEAIKAVQPDAAVMGWHPRNEVVRYETNRRFARSAPEWAYRSGEQAKMWRSRIPDSPYSSTSAAHIDYPWRQVLETGDHHMVRLTQQIANGAQPDLYLMGGFDDQNDHRFEKQVSDLFKWYAAHDAHYDDLKPGARVALYESQRNEEYIGGIPGGKTWEGTWRGAYTALLDQRVPFWMVSDERILDGTTTLTPAQFDAIVLPNVAVMNDGEAKALDAYVAAGGLVIATGQTGGYEGLGTKRAAMAMQSSPVQSFGDVVPGRGWTFDGETMEELAFDPVRIAVDGPYYNVVPASDARNLLQRAPNQRYGPPVMSYALPDAERGPEPGILVRKYGKGTAVHIPWLPEEIYYRQGLPDHARLFRAVIDKYAPPAPFRLGGDGPVEMTVMKPRTGKALIHLINYSGQRNGLYAAPGVIQGLKLGVRDDAGRVEAMVSSKVLNAGMADADGYRWYELPPLGAFEAIHLK